MKKSVKKFVSFALLGMVMFSSSATTALAKGDIIRPYTFGFGSAEEVDEGVYDLVQAGDLKHLTFEDSTGYSINYWIHIPKDAEGKPVENLPLVLYMHGYSDGGGDNNIAIRYHNALLFKLIQDQDKPERQAIVLVPQTPNAMNPDGEEDWFKDQWVGIQADKDQDKWTQWNRETWSMDETPRTKNLNAVIELLDKVQKENKADLDRAYVSGISMGGYTTWDLISRDDSHRFAAAVPICGVGDPSKIENVKDIPIRMFHGGIDPVINPKSSRRMYQELRKYGNVTYTEYADEEHPCWNSAYSPVLDDNKNGVSNLEDLIDWMFNQSRKGTINGAVDKEPLVQILNEAKNAKEENYTETVWNTLQADIQVAEAALDANVNKADTDEAVRKLDASLSDIVTDEAETGETSTEQSVVQEKQENNNTPVVVGVIVAIVAVLAGIFLLKRKK